MTSGQKSFPVIAPEVRLPAARRSGHLAQRAAAAHRRVIDDICLVRSLHTEAINHDPAITYIQTGSQQPGRPSLGAWVSYGLGSEADDLPAFVVMISHGSGARRESGAARAAVGQRLSAVEPSGGQAPQRRRSGALSLRSARHRPRAAPRDARWPGAAQPASSMPRSGDPEIATRIAQYEMAFRMQTSVPELTDLSTETAATFDLYGPDARKPGTFAANCLLARRLRRARRALRAALSPRLGPARQPARRTSPSSAGTSISRRPR